MGRSDLREYGGGREEQVADAHLWKDLTKPGIQRSRRNAEPQLIRDGIPLMSPTGYSCLAKGGWAYIWIPCMKTSGHYTALRV